MKVYEAVFNEGKTEGVYALSVVENPAMEDMWIALNEHPQKIELATVSDEKRLLLGAALIPNKKIYRNIDGNEFYITFKEDTIEKLAHSFFKNQNNNNSSLEHEVKLNGMSVVEGWIVEDPDNDKSKAYGKTYEKGTWVTMMKVDNDDVWNKVKSGEVKGFSIDALLSLKPLELSKNIKTDTKMTEDAKKSFLSELKEDIKALFTSQKEVVDEQVVETATVETAEEVTVEEEAFDAESFARDLKEKLSVEFKSQLDNALEEKNKEIESLKAELAKQPETQPLQLMSEPAVVELTTEGQILKLMRDNK